MTTLVLRLPVAAAFLMSLLWTPPALSADESASIRPLPRAHAHNDYLHTRPLHDALANGFCSVEADIFLVDGQLLVAHSRAELDPDRTLTALYLDPLQKQVTRNEGRVYRGGPPFTLLIDIKAAGEETFIRLNESLAKYPQVFSRFEGGTYHQKAVDVIISGDRPKPAIRKASPRYAGIDGRLSDLESDWSDRLMPLISDNWRSHFRWRGEGPMPDEERRKLTQIIEAAHARGRRVRFWASPDTPAVWEVLHDAGADLINTDDLPGLRRFLSAASDGR